jgi:hypothetical protein
VDVATNVIQVAAHGAPPPVSNARNSTWRSSGAHANASPTASSIQSRAGLHNPDMQRALHGLTTAVKSVRSLSALGRTTAARIVVQAELRMAGPAQRTGLCHWEAALRYRESFIEDAPSGILALRKAGVLFSADRKPIHPHQ